MKSLFWFRRDLRLDDNIGLNEALADGVVVPVFVFDRNILDKLPEHDARVEFIYNKILQLKSAIEAKGGDVEVVFGDPVAIIPSLAKKHKVTTVFTNRDYEPYARERDRRVKEKLSEEEVEFVTAKDQVIMEYHQVLKDDGNPYSVFTPYSKKWKSNLRKEDTQTSPLPGKLEFAAFDSIKFPTLEEMGFKPTNITIPSNDIDEEIIRCYDEKRDFPAVKGTSRLGLHLRFGTISIRKLAAKARELNETYLNELIWREFYFMILAHHPRIVEESFRPEYDRIEWRNDEEDFNKWKEGMTGYPLVDAGMRELNATGYMHNRVRMVVASFLCKHLLIDWRWGERYFAEKLLDYELASNNGGWQWAAGSGCDAAPYFRIFNPSSQLKKFDKDGRYVKKWVPELNEMDYPQPMVNHKMARERALTTYKEALKG